MERVVNFLKEAETYYLATVEGDQPRVRPFGTAHIFEGKLYIQTGKVKDVSKQIHANPKVEICAYKNGEWLRVAGELVEDDRREARQSMLDAYPSLQNMYSADFVVQIIVFGFVIPIAEEFMFRGVLYQRYRETRGFYYAAIWSALFFSVTHTNTVQMIYTFLLGILLCYVYEKFGSMKAPITLHVVLNLGSLLFTDIGVFNWLARESFKMAVAVIISTFICAACFVWIQRSGDPVSTQKTEE